MCVCVCECVSVCVCVHACVRVCVHFACIIATVHHVNSGNDCECRMDVDYCMVDYVSTNDSIDYLIMLIAIRSLLSGCY